MPKLHEGLAIHKDRAGVVKKVIDEARGVFKNGAHFQGIVKATEYFAAEDAKFNKTEEKKIDDTVPSKLGYVNEHFAKLLDLDYQIEAANTFAKADLIVGGMVVAKQVPVGFLLTIENKFKEYRAMLDMVPTHAPGIDWQADTNLSTKGDIYKAASEKVDYLTKKIPVYVTIAAATENHPAQVATSHDDVRVAKVVSTLQTGTISPAQKSDLLARCDLIIQGAKRARQRANAVEMPRDRVAKPLLGYLLDGTVPGEAVATEEEAI